MPNEALARKCAEPTNPELARPHDEPLENMTLEEFDAASNHPYECKCELCQRFWAELPPEE